MGRPERPLPSQTGPVCEFAAALRALRAQAGSPSYRQMADVTHYSSVTLARAAAGHNLPSPDVAVAYAAACGGERQEWELRWQACAQRVADLSRPSEPPDDVDTDGEGEHGRVVEPCDAAGPPPHTAPGLVARARRSRWASTAAAGLVLLAGTWIVTRGASQSPSAAAEAQRSASVAGGGRFVGSACARGEPLAPAPSATRTGVAARIRTGFEPGQPVWGPFWQHGNLAEEVTTEQHYDGADALKISVLTDLAAVGTTRIEQLQPGDTITVHVYYGGQGWGRICPFVQTKDFKVEWVAQESLDFTPADKPGWRTYSWGMPAVDALGIGIQLNNTGISDFSVLLDAVSW